MLHLVAVDPAVCRADAAGELLAGRAVAERACLEGFRDLELHAPALAAASQRGHGIEPTVGSPREDPRGSAGVVRGSARGAGARARRASRGRGAGPARGLRRLPHRPVHGFGSRSVRLLADRARARGSRRRRAGRGGRQLGGARRPRRDALLAAVSRVRALPRPADEPLPRDPRAAGPGLPARRDDALVPGRRAGAPLHGNLDLRRSDGDARDRAREGESRRRRSTGRACSPAGSRRASARR